jgi:DNA-binding transcriptional MerR regulator
LYLGTGLMLAGMRTSQLADQVGVNPQTLRYYERRGLLAPPRRSPSGYRDYPDSAIRLVRFVKRVQQLGFSLDDASALLQLAAGGPRACERARAMATAHIADIDQRIEDLTRMRGSLVELVATCDQPRADRRCSLLDALQDEEDVA